MKYILILLVPILLIFVPLVRCIVFNLHNIGIYSVYDLYCYIRYQKWKDFDLYGIDMFIGMFGHGKTLSMTHRAVNIYKQYGDRVRFISNYTLNGIPFVPLCNFNQLVDLGEDDSGYIGTVVLIDEIENVLNNRNYSKFPLALLHTLTQQRKKRVYIMCSAQRFFMVDKLFRSITTNVINCNKYWRFQHCELYDAWDLEQSQNYKDISRNGNIWYFIKNKDFNSYDTSEMISKNKAEDFISNDEALLRIGLGDVRINTVPDQRKGLFSRKARKG